MAGRLNEETAQGVFSAQVRAGMSEAAGMLSRFLEPRRSFQIRECDEDAPVPAEAVRAGVCLQVAGELSGAIFLQFPFTHARRLAGMLLRQPTPCDLEADAVRSTLKEAGNIFASGILASLEDHLKLRALPSPPTLLLGTRQELEQHYRRYAAQPGTFQICARLVCDAPDDVQITGTATFQLAEAALERFAVALAGKTERERRS